ncbi:hypothetical protein DIPPA_32909 [Diplonema papillatum]|nr:hypothetical protein DIPPA_10040 [Diplonema papillatum]KAJ9450936.1 hypothetical protein DIPPA_32909 [Diplonema papillatum]|eukprot:gene23098-35394_t
MTTNTLRFFSTPKKCRGCAMRPVLQVVEATAEAVVLSVLFLRPGHKGRLGTGWQFDATNESAHDQTLEYLYFNPTRSHEYSKPGVPALTFGDELEFEWFVSDLSRSSACAISLFKGETVNAYELHSVFLSAHFDSKGGEVPVLRYAEVLHAGSKAPLDTWTTALDALRDNASAPLNLIRGLDAIIALLDKNRHDGCPITGDEFNRILASLQLLQPHRLGTPSDSTSAADPHAASRKAAEALHRLFLKMLQCGISSGLSNRQRRRLDEFAVAYEDPVPASSWNNRNLYKVHWCTSCNPPHELQTASPDWREQIPWVKTMRPKQLCLGCFRSEAGEERRNKPKKVVKGCAPPKVETDWALDDESDEGEGGVGSGSAFWSDTHGGSQNEDGESEEDADHHLAKHPTDGARWKGARHSKPGRQQPSSKCTVSRTEDSAAEDPWNTPSDSWSEPSRPRPKAGRGGARKPAVKKRWAPPEEKEEQQCTLSNCWGPSPPASVAQEGGAGGGGGCETPLSKCWGSSPPLSACRDPSTGQQHHHSDTLADCPAGTPDAPDDCWATPASRPATQPQPPGGAKRKKKPRNPPAPAAAAAAAAAAAGPDNPRTFTAVLPAAVQPSANAAFRELKKRHRAAVAAEVRRAANGQYYTKKQFAAHFGGFREWDAAGSQAPRVQAPAPQTLRSQYPGNVRWIEGSSSSSSEGDDAW